MRKTARLATTALSLATLMAAAGMLPTVAAAADAAQIKFGKEVAFDRKKGNCLACHLIQGAQFANSNIAPPLIAMKARFPDKAKLREQIWDATVKNPNSLMPPFGKHKALTEKEIDLVVEFLYSL